MGQPPDPGPAPAAPVAPLAGTQWQSLPVISQVRPVVEIEWASPIWSDPESESRYALTTVQSNAHCD